MNCGIIFAICIHNKRSAFNKLHSKYKEKSEEKKKNIKQTFIITQTIYKIFYKNDG